MTMVSAIIFHELLPGHHYQLADAGRSPRLTGIRHTAMFTAYTEGWGDDVGLAGEWAAIRIRTRGRDGSAWISSSLPGSSSTPA